MSESVPCCSIPGCEKVVHARGWCKAHHTRFLRHGDPLYLDRSRLPIPPGTRLGRLVVVGLAVDRSAHGDRRYQCRCDCGSVTFVTGGSLRSGHTRSCGCFRHQARATHALSLHPLYTTWKAMIARCCEPTDHNWPRYGGRGIEVCARWLNSPANYIAHVSSLPHYGEPGRTLDRIDNDGNYEPGNVRWATAAEQQANTARAIAKRKAATA